jgi:hypothetical protein
MGHANFLCAIGEGGILNIPGERKIDYGAIVSRYFQKSRQWGDYCIDPLPNDTQGMHDNDFKIYTA